MSLSVDPMDEGTTNHMLHSYASRMFSAKNSPGFVVQSGLSKCLSKTKTLFMFTNKVTYRKEEKYLWSPKNIL